MPRRRSGKLSRYGDLTGRSGRDGANRPMKSADDIARMRDDDDAGPDSG
jgi:hypothetical protein